MMTKSKNQTILLMIIYGLILMTTLLLSKSFGMDTTSDEKSKNLRKEFLDELKASSDELDELGIKIGLKYNTEQEIGFKFEDLDFQDINELQYPYDFGAKIYKIYDGTPADEANLEVDDILMLFGGDTIKSKLDLREKIAAVVTSDKMPVTYFRKGEVQKAILYFDEIFSDYELSVTVDNKPKRIRKKYGVGILGFYWGPGLIMNDYQPANDLFEDLAFGSDELGQLWNNEFGFKFYVGNKMFLGMVFSGAEADGSTKLVNEVTNENIYRKMKFEQNLWGFTLDKRYRLNKKVILSAGCLIGSGKSTIRLQQRNGGFDWNQIWDENGNSNNDYLRLRKKEFLFEPHVSGMYKLFGPVWLQAEAGYMLGFSGKNWREQTLTSEYTISGAPEGSLFRGFSFTISPWIGL
ncbi:MAG: PDZ domain-containing protein [Candidatus Marinimicrobia bacterium]|nr:PDZ domain-containing protein [Candidatus Neomarinimicrobiota bacterium]